MSAQLLPDDEPLLSRDELHASMRKLATLRSALNELRETARRDHERINAWLDDESSDIVAEANVLESAIRAFMLAERAENPERKHEDTPWGRVQTREKPPKPVIADKDALFEWADSEGLIRVQTEADWAEILKRTKVAGDRLVVATGDSQGEVVPGVEIAPPEITVTVEVR